MEQSVIIKGEQHWTYDGELTACGIALKGVAIDPTATTRTTCDGCTEGADDYEYEGTAQTGDRF